MSKLFRLLGWLIIGYSVIRELAIASSRIHDLNGPTYLAIIYIAAAIIALFVPTLAKVMLLVKVGFNSDAREIRMLTPMVKDQHL